MSQPSGVAVLDWDGATLRLAGLDRLREPEEVLRWVSAEAGEDAGIGIDAPIVIPNATGMRIADKLAHSLYGKYHAGAYPASRARKFWKRTTGLSKSLAKLGFHHGDGREPKLGGRFQIEVHPHAATVQLFVLDRIVKYKKGKVADRATELRRLRKLMMEHLPSLVPSLAFTSLPEIPDRGLKAVEDRLDAILAAYIAAHWWYWGRERNDVLGDSKRGYIVVPQRYTADRKQADLRLLARNAPLDESSLDRDPIRQFEKWFAEACAAGLEEPGAMTLATVSSDGQPSARMVILRHITSEGFVFYTNYRSQKGRELSGNSRAALVFYWAELGRQVRVSGRIAKTSRSETQAYFATRPLGSQLAAWASWQSSVIPGRDFLEKRMRKLENKYPEGSVPPPPDWGGYRLNPDMIEFWQGRENRLHDRLRYARQADGGWAIERLAP